MPNEKLSLTKVTPQIVGSPGFVRSATHLFRSLVLGGAALGWVDPPSEQEISKLLREIVSASDEGDACLLAASDAETLAGLAYWRRYARPTHHPHADIEKIAVLSDFQGRGIGRALVTGLIDDARGCGDVEVLTLDFRADNVHAATLYRSLGFLSYGRLERFVAVGDRRYDKELYVLDLRLPADPE